jgi:hypothetical protein
MAAAEIINAGEMYQPWLANNVWRLIIGVCRKWQASMAAKAKAAWLKAQA